jgi:hypothetical protein
MQFHHYPYLMRRQAAPALIYAVGKFEALLVLMGVSDEEDLTQVTENDLTEFGVIMPLSRRRFFTRANKAFDDYTNRLTSERGAAQQLALNMARLTALMEAATISRSEFDEMRAAQIKLFEEGFRGSPVPSSKDPELPPLPSSTDPELPPPPPSLSPIELDLTEDAKIS